MSRIFRTISTGYIIDKEKAAKENTPLSPVVGIADEISNIKFIEDFDKIVNFMLSVAHV